MNAILALEDGTWFQGVSAGAPGEATGEVVFNTSMTGYQEILTDPSYAGQIVTMTAPQIGNYGVAGADTESARPQVACFVMREYCAFVFRVVVPRHADCASWRSRPSRPAFTASFQSSLVPGFRLTFARSATHKCPLEVTP